MKGFIPIILALAITFGLYKATPVRQHINNSTVVATEIATEIPIAEEATVSAPLVDPPITTVETVQETTLDQWKQDLLVSAQIPKNEWGALDYIISFESGWCANKWEGQIGYCPDAYSLKYEGAETDSRIGYGLCQSTPAIKMEASGEDWRTNPLTQIHWCYNYALGYGSVQAAADFKQCLGFCYSPRTKTTVFKKTTWF